MNFRNIFFIILTFSFFSSFAQSGLVVDVDFNDCITKDDGLLKTDITILGNISCECGLDGESLEFDGVDDALVFNNHINSAFNADFTIEFYFSVFNRHDVVDILSFKNECSSDSSFSLQYLPSIDEIRFVARDSEFDNVELSIALDDSKCWHHIAVVRKDFEYFIYLDGAKVSIENAGRIFVFAGDNVFAIADNPCVYDNNINYHRFEGRIDEFKIYNYAFNELHLEEIEIPSDMILNQDTTIYLGDAIDIKMGPTCAGFFNWSNKDDLDDPDILTPVITPKESSVYQIYLIMKGKACSDSIFIHIQDKDELDCEKLLLPNSFTPNGDGLNDIFEISNKFIIEELNSFEVYDRWGTRVFYTDDENIGWDGIYNNEKLNPSKLVYKVNYVCKEKEYLLEGILNLLR